MRSELHDDPVVVRFRETVREAYGERLERIVLFGSRARGDHKPDSDYDIAVFIRDHGTFWDETARLAGVEETILLDSGRVINSMPFPAGAHQEQTMFMGELRKDGLDL